LSRSKDKADAFLELLKPLQGRLEGYCRRMLRRGDQVEDVLQTVVTLAYAQFDRYVEGTNFKAWIFRFATFEIFNRNRRHEPITSEAIPGDLPAEESWGLVELDSTYTAMLDDPDVVLEYFDDIVIAALEKLAPRERAVLLLRSVGEFSYKEIHDLLGIPLGSVMGYLSRARQRMRLSLADYAAQHGLYSKKQRSPHHEGDRPLSRGEETTP
jgi:RNA polymerase sigma-70 factor (ECF subfamily)